MSQDKAIETKSSDVVPKRFIGAFVGLILGHIVGNNSATIAKIILVSWDTGNYVEWRVTQISLVIIFVFACIGVGLGAFMVKRGWAESIQIVWSMVAAILVAFFAIAEQALPEPLTSSGLPFTETLYYLGWMVGFFLLPIFLLPNQHESFAVRIQSGANLMAVSGVMAVSSWIAGFVIVETCIFALENWSFLSSIMKGDSAILRDSRKFWLASPSTVNPILALIFVVAFSPIWWQNLWKCHRVAARLWIIFFVVMATSYTIVFGRLIYVKRDWLDVLVTNQDISPWEYSLALGAFPLVVTATVLVAWRLTEDTRSSFVGWPVSNLFWWLLPLGLAFGFSAISFFGFGPIVRTSGASSSQVAGMTVAHAINGALLGFVFRLFVLATRLVYRKKVIESTNGSP